MLKNVLRLCGFLLVINFLAFLVQLPASERSGQTTPPIIQGGKTSVSAGAPPTTSVGPSGCGCGSGSTRPTDSPGLLPGEQRFNELQRELNELDTRIGELHREKNVVLAKLKTAEGAKEKLESSIGWSKSNRYEAAEEQIQQQKQRLQEIENEIKRLEVKRRELLEEYNTLAGSVGRKAGRDYLQQKR